MYGLLGDFQVQPASNGYIARLGVRLIPFGLQDGIKNKLPGTKEAGRQEALYALQKAAIALLDSLDSSDPLARDIRSSLEFRMLIEKVKMYIESCGGNIPKKHKGKSVQTLAFQSVVGAAEFLIVGDSGTRLFGTKAHDIKQLLDSTKPELLRTAGINYLISTAPPTQALEGEIRTSRTLPAGYPPGLWGPTAVPAAQPSVATR